MKEAPTPTGVSILWRCPCCPAYRSLPELWAHLKDAHQIDMTADPYGDDWLLRGMATRLVSLIEDAMNDPVEYIPSRIRHATRELRAVLDGRKT